jgi:hypothetical protein
MDKFHGWLRLSVDQVRVRLGLLEGFESDLLRLDEHPFQVRLDQLEGFESGRIVA